MRSPQSLEEGLVEIVIDLAGDVFHGWRSTAFEWVESGVAELDEARAFDTASKLPGVDPKEWKAIVELGRAHTHALLERPDFQTAHAALVPVLLKAKILSGEAVESICAAAIATLPDFSAPDPCDAEGAVAAHSAAHEGAGDADLLGPPSNWGRRPPSDPDCLTGNSGGGRLAGELPDK